MFKQELCHSLTGVVQVCIRVWGKAISHGLQMYCALVIQLRCSYYTLPLLLRILQLLMFLMPGHTGSSKQWTSNRNVLVCWLGAVRVVSQSPLQAYNIIA